MSRYIHVNFAVIVLQRTKSHSRHHLPEGHFWEAEDRRQPTWYPHRIIPPNEGRAFAHTTIHRFSLLCPLILCS